MDVVDDTRKSLMFAKRFHKVALQTTALALLAIGGASTGNTVQAGGGGGSDLLQINLTSLCPQRVTLNGNNVPFSCYNIRNEVFDKGALEGKTLTFSGDWKVRCGDNVERPIGNFSFGFALSRNTGRFPAASVPNPCGGGMRHMAIDTDRYLAGYGVGTNFSTTVVPNFHN